MAGLSDVAKITHVVNLTCGEVTVKGLSLGALGRLIERFPEFRTLAAKQDGFSVQSLLSLGPEFVSAFLAAGVNQNWTAEDETVAADMSLDDQVQLLLAILKVSMPRGAGPFVETLIAIMTVMGFIKADSTDGSPKAGSTQQAQSSRSAEDAGSRKMKRSA